MAFSITVEDGSADPDANSYCDFDVADDYISTNAFTSAEWLAMVTLDKQKLLSRSSKYLDRMVQWEGQRVDQDSGMRWPRSGVYDADGFEIADDVIPQALIDAVCEMAMYLMDTDWTNLESSRGIKEVRADVVDVKFDTNQTRGAVPFAVISILTGLGTVNTGKRPAFKKIVRS